MVRCASLFSQLIALFNRRDFYRLIVKHRAERYSKGFSSWDHFVGMLFCQLAQAKSLREICGGLACTTGKLRHPGMRQAPKKSTLSYANAHRPLNQLFRSIKQLIDDLPLRKSVARLDERVGVFDTLREALRIALPEGKNGLNDDGDDADMKTIEEKVKGF